jgi:AcrR family transcriptional regulator
MRYRSPVQDRAIKTEHSFVEAAKKLFADRGFAATTIDDIAAEANLHRGAFLKRFGSKHTVKLIIYEEYCRDALCAMDKFVSNLPTAQFQSLEDAFSAVSQGLEQLQRQHFAANRVMYEDYASGLIVHEKTKEIFRALVKLVEATDLHLNPQVNRDKSIYFNTSQLLVTLNYENVLSAMPGLPQCPLARQKIIVTAAIQPLLQDAMSGENTLV